MFKKEIIQVEEIMPGDYALAICKKYNISGENIIGELKLGSGKLIVLTNSQIHFVDELSKQVETMRIYKPNFDEVKAEIDIRYYRNERNDDIEQTILKCKKQDEVEKLVTKYKNNTEIQVGILAKQQELSIQEGRLFGIIVTIFSVITVAIGILAYFQYTTQKSPILFLVLEWLPIYLSLIWLASTLNLMIHKGYTKENAVFTLFTGFGIASTLIMNGFNIGYCLFILLFSGPALYYLCYHWKEATFIKKESVYSGIALLLTMVMFVYSKSKVSVFVLSEHFGFFDINVLLLVFYIVIGIFGIAFILDEYKWRIGILYTLIAISAAFPQALHFDRNINTIRNAKSEIWHIEYTQNNAMFSREMKIKESNGTVTDGKVYIIDGYTFEFPKGASILKVERKKWSDVEHNNRSYYRDYTSKDYIYYFTYEDTLTEEKIETVKIVGEYDKFRVTMYE